MEKIVSSLIAISIITSGALFADTINAAKISDDLSKITPDSKVWSKAKIKALYNDKQVAFLLTWPDGTKSIQSGYESTNFADGFAVQIPTNYSNPTKLPYIGMGSNDGASFYKSSKSS